MQVAAADVNSRTMDAHNIVELELPKRNITVLGAFNPAILNPSWVLKNLPIAAPEIETLIEQQGVQVLYRAGDLMWSPGRNRLIVYGDEAQAGEFVSRLALTLPHTPFTAVGMNFQSVGQLDLSTRSDWHVSVALKETESLLGGETSEISLAHAVTREDGVRMSLRIVLPGGGTDAILHLNYHLQVSTISDDNQRIAELVSKHALRAEEFAAEAVRIGEAILNG